MMHVSLILNQDSSSTLPVFPSKPSFPVTVSQTISDVPSTPSVPSTCIPEDRRSCNRPDGRRTELRSDSDDPHTRYNLYCSSAPPSRGYTHTWNTHTETHTDTHTQKHTQTHTQITQHMSQSTQFGKMKLVFFSLVVFYLDCVFQVWGENP